MADAYTTIREFMYLHEADNCASALRGNGFEVVTENANATAAGIVGAAAMVKVMVPEEDAERALAFLREHEGQNPGEA